MKVALCFIISYQHILNKEQFWIDWIKPNQDIINVYFHYKDFSKIQSPWIRLHSLPPKLVQATTYCNVMPAYMSVLSYAYKHDTENQWFCLLTESCVPIVSPQKFRELFLNHYQASIIQCKPAYWDITIHRRANLRLLGREYWLANDPWFTLSRDHVHKCILFLTLKTSIYNKINDGGLANESMFAIILQTFQDLGRADKHVNESATVADWLRMSTATSPYYFKDATDQNMDIIHSLLRANKHAMFLRKVHPSFPDTSLQKLMETDFHHTYPRLHNTAKPKDTYAYISSWIRIIPLLLTLLFLTRTFITKL